MTLADRQLNKLKVFQRKIKRSLLGITLKDCLQNTKIGCKTGVKDIGSEISKEEIDMLYIQNGQQEVNKVSNRIAP